MEDDGKQMKSRITFQNKNRMNKNDVFTLCGNPLENVAEVVC